MTDALLLFAITEFFLSLSPGPAVLLVVSISLNRGLSGMTGAVLGILSVNIVFFTLSALGVGAVIASSPNLAFGLKVIGCGYLAYTAVKIILEVYANRSVGNDTPPLQKIKAKGLADGFFKGFIIQASSIKNIMIFVAIIPQFVDFHAPIWPQMLALGIVSVLVEAPVLFAYGLAAWRLSKMVGVRTSNLLDLVSAALLIIVAGSVAMI